MAKARQLVMPKLGLTMTEGTVVEWSVEEGAQFEAGKTIVVVETDKVANEVEAPAAGRMTKILVQVSETVQVGAPIAEWEPLGDVPEAPSGPKLEAAAKPTLMGAAPSAAEVAAARRMVEAKQTIPHFYLSLAIDVAQLAARRSEWNGAHPSSKATVTHVFLFVVANALRANPDLNKVWISEDRIEAFRAVDIGIAIDTPAGLRAPVLRNVAGLTLTQLVTAANDLRERAQAGRLTANDSGSAAITVSNVGAFGVDSVTSIINPGQSMILGVGRERTVLRLEDSGTVVPSREITVTLSCDHRVLDGASGARLLRAVRDALERPAGIFGD